MMRLTSDSGLTTDPAVSPDGKFVAYASDRAGNFDIWVQPVAGGDPVQVTKSPEPDTQPAWSPDGSTIVFRSERDGGGLYRVPALGGQEQQLASFGMHPTWSKDGAAVFFIVGPNLESGAGPAHHPPRRRRTTGMVLSMMSRSSRRLCRRMYSRS